MNVFQIFISNKSTAMNDTLLTLFCLVDDFCVQFYPYWQKQLITSGIKKRQRNSQMTPSEMMTLFIHFQQSRFRDFKSYYLLYVRVHLKQEFPNTLSYTRFVSLIKSLNVPLCFFLQTLLGDWILDKFITKFAIDAAS